GLDRLIRQTKLTGEALAQQRVAKLKGRYWRRPCEQFARAWEQLVSSFCDFCGVKPVGVVPYSQLRREKAQWDTDNVEFGILEPVLNLFPRWDGGAELCEASGTDGEDSA
ncbi:MAG: hypothetical protein ABGZ53_01850, partial [Fuerstiella sp.]